MLLLLVAFIWGTAFVAQRVGMESMGPMLFNAVRFALGALVILPLAILRREEREHSATAPWRLLGGGLAAGAILFAGAALQQMGLVYTTAGKAGFITGLYVVIVPVLALFMGNRTGRGIWFGAVLATLGLYLLSVTEDLSIARGDLIVLMGAFFWAMHVLVVGGLARRLPVARLAALQFVTCALLSFAAAALSEPISWQAIREALIPILYGGVLSVGVGYTLQVFAQKEALAAHAAIILSLESVFAALAGWVVLGETLGWRALIGCALMLTGMLIAQLVPLRGKAARSRGLPQGEHPA